MDFKILLCVYFNECYAMTLIFYPVGGKRNIFGVKPCDGGVSFSKLLELDIFFFLNFHFCIPPMDFKILLCVYFNECYAMTLIFYPVGGKRNILKSKPMVFFLMELITALNFYLHIPYSLKPGSQYEAMCKCN